MGLFHEINDGLFFSSHLFYQPKSWDPPEIFGTTTWEEAQEPGWETMSSEMCCQVGLVYWMK